MYISDFDSLAAFCERASGAKVLAVDTEFLRERTFYPKVCLIQLATPEESCAVDPILIDDLSPVRRLFEDTSITKIFHACTQDLEVINHDLGCIPEPIFDTQLAAAFLGLRQQIGYGALVESYCNVHLPKAESLTDWSKRPLDAEQLKYAEDDVRYLPGIYERMVEELVKLDRLSWLAPEMERLSDPDHVVRPPELAYRHLKRSGSLTRRQLSVARELCAWRDGVASRRDIPRKWVMSDEVIVESCKRFPKSVDALKRIRGTEQLARRDATAETESVVDLMYAMLRLISDKSGVATQLIATRDDLLEFVNHREKSALASSWRYELAGKTLEELLDGQVGLTVKDGKVEKL